MKTEQDHEIEALRQFMQDFDTWHTQTPFPESLYNELYHRMYTSWQAAKEVRSGARRWRLFDTPEEHP